MLSKLKYFVEQSWLLIVAAFFFGLLLAVTNTSWNDRIVQNEEDKFNNLAKAMLTQAATFELAIENAEIKSSKGKIIKIKINIKKALSADGQCVGWAFVCKGAGFADIIKLVLTADADFEKLAGYGVLSSNETPGFGDKIKNDYYRSQFAGVPAKELVLSKIGDDKIIDDQIIAITGATVSSEAVVTILNNYIGQVKTILQKDGPNNDGK